MKSAKPNPNIETKEHIRVKVEIGRSEISQAQFTKINKLRRGTLLTYI